MAARGSHALSKASKAIRAPPASFLGPCRVLYTRRRSCQSVRFRHADRQNPTQLSFLQGDENVHFIGGFASSRGLVVASPPRRRGPQVRAPWRHGGHGVVDVVGPVVPPGRARGRGDAGVYTDRRKWPLGAVLGHLCTLLRCCRQMWGRRSVHRSAKMTSRSRFGSIVYTVAMQGSREWRRRQVGVFAEVATHTNPRGARYRN